VRAFFTYGFVPWVVRRLDEGDEVPEVLCNGTFHWYTEIPSRDPQSVRQQKNAGHVAYRVQITSPLEYKDKDVAIFVHTAPALDVSVNSMLYATVPSPLSHVLTDYKNLRQAQIRRSHADAWNTTAKLICSFKPTIRVQEDPGASLMDFADDSYYQPGMHMGIPAFAPLNATNLWSRDAQIKKQFDQGAAGTTHQPDVYTLPRDHDVAQQPMLTPCEDLDFLMSKFQRDVCAVTGVPEEMVRSQAHGAQETVRKTMASGRIFSSNMVEVCRQLQELLRQVRTTLALACVCTHTPQTSPACCRGRTPPISSPCTLSMLACRLGLPVPLFGARPRTRSCTPRFRAAAASCVCCMRRALPLYIMLV